MLFAHLLYNIFHENRIVSGDEINTILDTPTDILLLVYGPNIYFQAQLLRLLDPSLLLL